MAVAEPGKRVNRKPVELEYATPESREPTALDDFLAGLFVGRLRSKWLYLQFIYYLALAGFFVTIAFYAGPNLINFGRLSSLTTADFVADVKEEDMRTVRAMKEFQGDRGRLPNDASELVPRYLSHQPEEKMGATVHQGQFYRYSRWNHRIFYDFSAGTEGWYVGGALARGRIPLPPVKLTLTTKPATQTN
jgi:hypothetical protein